jgi:hypothetical protein
VLVARADPNMGFLSAARFVMSVKTNVVLIIAGACGYYFLSGVQTFGMEFVHHQYNVSTFFASVLLLVVGGGAVIGVLVAGWKAIGIQVNVEFASNGQAITACSTTPSAQLCAWDTGWTYAPAVLPTGESLFATTGSANVGAFSNAAIDALINQTLHAPVPLTRYAKAVSTALPALFIPRGKALAETAKNLQSTVGLAPNPIGSFTPSFYHW